MSRIGRLHITVPAGVTVEYNNQVVTVKGPKGTLTQHIDSRHIGVTVEGNEVHVTRNNEELQTKAMHGLYRALIHNMVTGVVTPYTKTLVIAGVGYKAAVAGNKLTMSLGFSHPVDYTIPEGVSIAILTMNLLTPFIGDLTKRKTLGGVK